MVIPSYNIKRKVMKMRFYTHIAAAIIFYVITFRFLGLHLSLTLAGVSLIASLLPDIDTPRSISGRMFHPLSSILKAVFGHRGITHSILSLFLLTALLFKYSDIQFSISFFTGYSSHIILDMLGGGVRLLYPYRKKYRLTGKRIKKGEEPVFAFLLFLLAFILIKTITP
ncbi:inner membrane protein YdjM [archaeon BMS3Bbin15]|nr:inner membrane protein YdjM [archaeon BMS3Bbin15]